MNDISDERVSAVRAQVERICTSERFATSRKLAQFLRLVVEESLAGRGDQIKEYSIGLEVYNRPSGYDPRIDATVRVEAAKLRKRLGEYYAAEGNSDPIVITIPKGRYAPAFAYPEPTGEQQPGRFPWWAAVAVLVFGLAAGLWWAFTLKPAFKIAGFRLISIFPGSHAEASFSPDGATIAFIAKNGGGPAQVWVKNLSHGDPLRITEGETDASRPRWSPKTDQIVFARKGRGIWTVPPLGGPARRIIDQGRNPDFSPDGSQLVFEKGRQIMGGASRWQRTTGVLGRSEGNHRNFSAGVLSGRKMDCRLLQRSRPQGRSLGCAGIRWAGAPSHLRPARRRRPGVDARRTLDCLLVGTPGHAHTLACAIVRW